MNSAQRIEKAMVRVEEASAELQQSAFRFGQSERGTWDNSRETIELQKRARSYANAMRALQRANKRVAAG